MLKLQLIVLCLLSCFVNLATSLDYVYHNYENLTKILKDYSVKYPTKAYLYSIGKSVAYRDLWVLAISGRQPDTHVQLRPEVKLVGNIHGNEMASGEVLLHFIDYLLTNQNADASVDYILRNVRVHVLVSLNPDGVEVALASSSASSLPSLCDSQDGRNNSNNYDLNMNFPDKFYCNRETIQPETKAIMDWLDSNTFVLSAKLETGFIVASYPWENYKKPPASQQHDQPPHLRLGGLGVDFATDFDDMFMYLASRYSFNHKTMRTETCNGESFKDGITNGVNGFERVQGGMQDFNFFKHGCSELTIGISCCVRPAESGLSELWQANTKSLVEFTKRANTGVRGIIDFKNRGAARYVGVRVDAREPVLKTNAHGEFYVLLVPGVYTLSVVLGSCDVVLLSSQIQVPERSRLLVLNITLSERDYERAAAAHLDRYPMFCTKANMPVDCSAASESEDSSSSSSGSHDAHHDESSGASTKSLASHLTICYALLIFYILFC